MSTQQTTNSTATDDLIGADGGLNAGPTTGPSGGGPGLSLADQMGAPVTYRCGDCNAKVPLKRDDPVRCIQCGYRVLYKERTKR
jgi:DNA-directed RNA polymerases I, II, and III subunit RPABC4